MFSVLEGIDNFNHWIANSPVGWIILNPLFLSILITVLIMFLFEYYKDDDGDDTSTKFIIYSFLIVFVPIMINNNVIDRKRIEGSFEINEDDFIEYK